MTMRTKTTWPASAPRAGWRTVRLGDVADVQWGDTNTTKAAYRPSGYRAFSATGSDGFMGYYDFDRDGVVLSAIGANCGETWFTNGKWSCIKNTIRFWGEDGKADTRFLYYKTHNKNLWPQRGSAQPFISQTDARNIELEIPADIDEQKRIAGILSVFDEKIENNNRITSALEEMAQAIFREWFIENAKSKNQNAKLWEEKRLGEIMQFEYGKALRAEERKGGDIPVVGSSGIVRMHNQKLVTGPGIVVGRKGTVGNVIWLDTDFYPIDTTFYVVSKLSLYFCFFLLKRQKFITGDSAVPGLNRNSALSSEVSVPPEELIDKFEEKIKPLFQEMYNIKQENQKLAAMRDLLLPRLMSEELSVKK